jgi:hypothetical protein
VALDDPLGDREPEAGTASFAGPVACDTVETVEDVELFGVGNSNPGVADFEDRLIWEKTERQRHFPSGGGVFHGVIEQDQAQSAEGVAVPVAGAGLR